MFAFGHTCTYHFSRCEMTMLLVSTKKHELSRTYRLVILNHFLVSFHSHVRLSWPGHLRSFRHICTCHRASRLGHGACRFSNSPHILRHYPCLRIFRIHDAVQISIHPNKYPRFHACKFHNPFWRRLSSTLKFTLCEGQPIDMTQDSQKSLLIILWNWHHWYATRAVKDRRYQVGPM